MAKSLRSKWKRKMRAIKRVRYGKKELEKLKILVKSSTDVEMAERNSLVTVVMKSQMTRTTETMETDQTGGQLASLGENNTFPIWFSSHRRKKIMKINKKKKKEEKKLIKKEKKKFKR